MARSLFIALFLACATLSAAQTNLDALPKAERDSTLVAIVQKLLRAKFPAYYRENIRPEITERKYAPSPKDSVPEGVTPGEPCYYVKLHYDNWAAEAAFEDSYTASAIVLARSGKIPLIMLGSRYGYAWPESDKIKPQKDIYAERDSLSAARNRRMSALPRLSALPQAERDSILVGILQHFLKTCEPKHYRKNVRPVITQGDFREEVLFYSIQSRKPYPKYLEPTDICYEVTLYYPRWRDEGFRYPYTAQAIIREKSRELCKVNLGGKDGTQQSWFSEWSTGQLRWDKRELLATDRPRTEEAERVAWESLKEYGSYWRMNDLEASVSTGTFEWAALEWLPWKEKVPEYVEPTDTCYRVRFYDTKWRERALDFPLMAEVYIDDRLLEVFRKKIVFDNVRWEEWTYSQLRKKGSSRANATDTLHKRTDPPLAQAKTVQPQKAKHSRTAAEAVQRVLKEKFPDWYQEEVSPVVWQSDFRGESLLWEAGKRKRLPATLAAHDICYEVTLYCKNWREEGFLYPYTARAVVVGETNEIYSLELGGRQKGRFDWEALQGRPEAPQAETPLGLLPAAARDSILIGIAKETVRKKMPQWQVEDFDASIEQGNFELLRLEWMSPDDRTPDYVLPEDIYYKVVFCDRKWHDRHLFYPHMMDVYIVEKTREVFKLALDYDWARWYDKSKP